MELRLHHIIDHLYNIFLENDGSDVQHVSPGQQRPRVQVPSRVHQDQVVREMDDVYYATFFL